MRKARPDTLPAVRVTVLRTPETATRAPYAVATVDQRRATAERPGFGLGEALGAVAGVQVDNHLSFALGERISIRGIGARSQFGTRGVRIIVDDIPATLADGQSALNNVDLGSLGGAEVLRGPAAALYGNASGGVILLRTESAPLARFAPSLRLLSGSYGLQRAQLGVGGTSGAASYVVNADRLDYRGYRAFQTARNAHANAVATYDWDRASVRLVANVVRYDAQNPGALNDSLLHRNPRMAYPVNVTARTGERGAQGQYGAAGRAQLGPGELQLSLYALTRGIDNPIPPRIVVIQRAAGGARATYALAFGDTARSLTTLFGAASDLQRDDRQNYVNVRGARGARVLDQLERVTSVAPFAQLSARADRVNAFAAVRHDAFRFAVADHLVTPTDPNDSGVRHMAATSPSAGLSVVLAPAATLYVNAATAFETPTTTELANRPSGSGGFNPDLQPEHIHSREIGLKGRLARVAYDMAAYDMRIDGELIPFEVPSTPGRQYYRNAGAARHTGADLDVSAIVLPGVTAHAAATFIDARYVHYTVGSASFAGNRVPGIAPRALAASIELGVPTARFLAVEERLLSSMPTNDANTDPASAFAITNLRAGFHVHGAGIFAGIDNIFDRRYVSAIIANAAAGRYFEPGAGRSLYVGLELLPRR